MKPILTLFFLLLLVLGNVLQVNDKNFKEIVLDSGKFTLVDFYADWCRHCQKLMPDYEEVGRLFADDPEIQIVKVNGDKDGKRIVNKYDIPGFPTIMFFNGDKDPIEYEGARDSEAISNFVQLVTGHKITLGSSDNAINEVEEDFQESNVLRLDDSNFDDLVLQSGKTVFVAFTALWCGHCQKLLPIWEQLANKVYKDESKITFGRVETDVDSAEEVKLMFGITSFPTLLLFDTNSVPDKDGARRPSQYFDGRSLGELVNFINENLGLHRNVDGTLLPTAGRIHYLDKLIKEQLAGENNEQVAPKLLKELNKLIVISRSSVVDKEVYVTRSDDFTMESYYRKLLNKLLNGENKYFQTELNRLNKLLKYRRNQLTDSATDSIQKRANILQLFL